MIKFNFHIDESELLELSKPGTFTPHAFAGETYYEWMPEGTYELIVDDKKMPDIWRPCPIICLAAQLRWYLHHIEVGQTEAVRFMDDGGTIHISRPSQDTITLSNRHLSIPPISCNFYELREAADDFGRRMMEFISERLPELARIDGVVLRKVLLGEP